MGNEATARYCKNGHRLAGDNLVISNDGRNRCRECLKVYRARWNDKNRDRLREYSRRKRSK